MDGKENESEDFWERLVDGNGKKHVWCKFCYLHILPMNIGKWHTFLCIDYELERECETMIKCLVLHWKLKMFDQGLLFRLVDAMNIR